MFEMLKDLKSLPILSFFLPDKIYFEGDPLKDQSEDLSNEIYFSCYYWFCHSWKYNEYAWREEVLEFAQIIPHNMTRKEWLAKVAMCDLVEICTYHAYWIYQHGLRGYHGSYITELDDMSQSDHVNKKNLLNFIIKAKIDERNELMEEIRNFADEPPIRKFGVSGYRYKKAERSFKSLIKK